MLGCQSRLAAFDNDDVNLHADQFGRQGREPVGPSLREPVFNLNPAWKT